MSARSASRGMIAIASREVSARASLLGLAALLAVAPAFLPDAITDRPFLRFFCAVVMTAAAAIVTGSSVIARDLVEGRLGFFLARPIPWWSLWGGKWMAAVVLTFASGAIVMIPVLAGPEPFPANPWWSAALFGPMMLGLIGVAHVATVGYRSQSPWLLLDAALAALLGWAVVETSLALAAFGLWQYGLDFMSAGLWVLAIAVTAAAAAQVAWGGSDIRRARRVLLVALWSVLVPAVAGYAAWGAWVARLSPRDLARVAFVQASADGAWIVAAGHARPPRPESVFAAVLVEPRTGRFLRLGPGTSSRLAFSDDGGRAAWMTDTWSDEPRLFGADLRSGQTLAATRVPLPLPPGSVFGLSFSPGGTHIAAVQGQQATLFALGSSEPAVVLPTPRGPVRRVGFSGDGRAHVLVGPDERTKPGVLDVVVLDPASRRSTVTGHIATRGNPNELWGPGADRVAIVHRSDFRPSLTLHDGATGALLATPVDEGAAGRVSATFLHDGRLAVVETGAGVRLRVFTRDGVEVLSLAIAPQFAMAQAFEVEDGVVAVQLPFQAAGGASRSVLVDVAAGRVTRVEQGLRPAAGGFPREVTDSPASRLFIDDRGAVVRLDVATGARTIVLGGR